jgi:hypothetical protein
VHASIGESPFFAMYSYHPRSSSNVVDDVLEGEIPTAKERAETVLLMRETLKERLQNAIEYQAKWYNKKHEPKYFAVVDWVLLSTKNLRQSRPSRKLLDRFLGPF